MNKLRLLITPNCNRRCPGCCNKDWELDKLPVFDFVENDTKWDIIMVTGGEPMILSESGKLSDIVRSLRFNSPDAQLILYTAWNKNSTQLMNQLVAFDGVTLTLHEQTDVEPFIELQFYVKLWECLDKSNFSKRLNVFKGVEVPKEFTDGWQVKDNIEWIKNCPLPTGETFMRL